MKKSVIAVISLVLGLFIGWYFGRQVSDRLVHEQFKKAMQGYPPGFVTSMWNMAVVMKGMTTNEIQETLNFYKKCNLELMDEYRIKDYYNGLLALWFHQLIEKGDTNKMQEVISETIQGFAKRVDEGDYKGTPQEEAANAMVQRWRNQTNSPTNKSTVRTDVRP